MISRLLACLLAFGATAACAAEPLRGTGDLGLVIERGRGSVLVIETSTDTAPGRVEGLGDLSHASAVFSRDERFAYVFGRDGGLSKVGLLTRTLAGRVVQGGNSIGGAISQDGRLVAVSNYEPGGVRIFDAATLALVADIPAAYGEAADGGSAGNKLSKVIGLVDAPGRRFVFSFWDAGEIWVADLRDPARPEIRRFKDIGRQPYDALITPDGRHCIAGLFGEDGLALLDLWDPDSGVRRILPSYGQGGNRLPVYKMPHLDGWAIAGDRALVPAVGAHQVLVIDTRTWAEVGRIEVLGQPVFVRVRPDGRQVWVNFALPDNGQVQVIDTRDLRIVQTLNPGPGVLHMEFEPKGEAVWVSVRDADRVDVYDTATFARTATLPAEKPSGIFLTDRAGRIGL